MRIGSSSASWTWLTTEYASPPAIWGKLPSHGDFIQHSVRAGEVQAWQLWLAEHVRPATAPKPTVVPQFRAGERWMNLDASQRHKPLAQRVPVAFVLPPGSLAFAREHVLGVMVNSHDRLGREHPLIVYHCANRRWIDNHLVGGEFQTSGDAPWCWMFALARLLDHYLQPVDEDAQQNTPDSGPRAGADGMALQHAIDRLWALYAPGWPQRLGMATRLPSGTAVRNLLAQAPALLAPAPSEGLQGMPLLPWVDWPERLWAKPCAAFWQQDSLGGYVGASLRLRELWTR